MSVGSKRKNKTLLAVLAAILIGVLLFAVALEVGKAEKEKRRFVSASERMALLDFAEALRDMESAERSGDLAALNRAAGKAEAYLSRAGIGDCGEVYGVIGGICSGEYGAESLAVISDAAQKALDGDGGAALRSLFNDRDKREETTEETTEDQLSSRVLKRLGKARDDVAYNRAVSFACPNAVFEECESGAGIIKYAGENIYISIAGESARVQMYCFDRDVDGRYSVSEEEAMQTVKHLLKREKLRLDDGKTEYRDGIYSTIFAGEGEYADIPLVTIEVYGDTGRLRKYDAVNYYRIGR